MTDYMWSGDWSDPGHGQYIISTGSRELEPAEVIDMLEERADLLEQQEHFRRIAAGGSVQNIQLRTETTELNARLAAAQREIEARQMALEEQERHVIEYLAEIERKQAEIETWRNLVGSIRNRCEETDELSTAALAQQIDRVTDKVEASYEVDG